MSTGIYKITNKTNGKVYIGQSRDINTRWHNHKRELNSNRHHNSYLQSSWNKYGEANFLFSLIEVCNANELDDREMYWISYYNSNNASFGYNLTAGGGGHSGYNMPDEMKEHLSSMRTKDNIVQVDLNGNFINEWRSASHAARTLNIPVSGIRQCVLETGDQFQCHGYIWILSSIYYSESFDIYNYINIHIIRKPKILQYDLYGKLIKVWKNKEEIYQNVSSSNYKCILRVLKHDVRSINGYIYLYDNDELELTDDYLLQCRINVYVYSVKQLSKKEEYIKTWSQQELLDSHFNFEHIRICCTKNRYYTTKQNKKFSSQGYIWEYE